MHRALEVLDEVEGIVIAGAGKAFVAGADIRFFVSKIDEDAIDDIVDHLDDDVQDLLEVGFAL